MTVHTPVFAQPASGDAAINYSAQEFRQFTRATLTPADGVGGTQGVTSAASYQVTQRGAGANLSVDVAAGLAYVVGADVTNQGTYVCWNDGTVNVTGITVPGTGTYHHRIVLQVQDKLSNGTWTGYAGVITALLDTGTGLPAEPNSAITLATIDVPSGSASVLNSMINDYRQKVGGVAANKTADLGRATTTLADDPDLQLLNLQAGAWYEFTGAVIYSGGTGGSEGDLQWAFRMAGVASMRYAHGNFNLSNAGFGTTQSNGGDVNTAGTQGTGVDLPLTMTGFIHTSSVPCYAVLQWAQNSLQPGTNSWLRAGSLLRCRRIA